MQYYIQCIPYQYFLSPSLFNTQYLLPLSILLIFLSSFLLPRDGKVNHHIKRPALSWMHLHEISVNVIICIQILLSRQCEALPPFLSHRLTFFQHYLLLSLRPLSLYTSLSLHTFLPFISLSVFLFIKFLPFKNLTFSNEYSQPSFRCQKFR